MVYKKCYDKTMEKESTIPLWALSIDDALATQDSSCEGLTYNISEERQKIYGYNVIFNKKRIHTPKIFFRQFMNPLIFVLLAAALVTAFLREWIDMGVIMFAVLVNVFLAFYQEYRAEHTIERLSSYIKEIARVVRDGVEREIDSSELVPGDIIRLSYGARIPADARLISVNALSIDESILTGESLSIQKKTDILSEGTPVSNRTNMVHAGTLVVEGYGTAVVMKTGIHTELGRIAELVSKTGSERTPLQKSLWHLAWIIFFVVLFVVAGVFFLGISRGEPALEMLVIAIAVAVGAVPEALPIALTVILAAGSERIAAVNGIMRSLAAAETLGSASVIMVDKTGTLTEANMRMMSLHTFDEIVEGEKHTKRDILLDAFSSGDVIVENPSDEVPSWRFAGNPIERGIAKALLEREGDNFSRLFTKRQSPLLAFNSTNKFSIAESVFDGKRIVVGAPDILLKRSDISKESFIIANEWIARVSSEGKRLVGVGVLHTTGKGPTNSDSVSNITFLGVLVFQDPLRTDTIASVKHIERLGARVVMVTGDLKGTAIAVARKLGWDVNEGEVLTGEEIALLSDNELQSYLSHIKIFARVTPEQKLRIGVLFKQHGEVVAMTGDGVNDAPSLRAVDIGVALSSGSDVAKSVADLVLLDDSFKTIVSAIEEGRRMLVNIRKSFVYLMSNSLDEVILIGGSLLVGLPIPLTALQIIWVNLFTGSLPAISFAFDEDNDKKEYIHMHDNSVLNKEVRYLTLGIGIITSLLLFGLYWVLLAWGIAFDEARAILFICFAGYILVVAYSFRSLRRPLFSYPIFSNTFLNVSIVGAVALLFLSMSIPLLRDVFSLTPPPVGLLWIVIVWFIVNVAIVEGAKWGFRHFIKE